MISTSQAKKLFNELNDKAEKLINLNIDAPEYLRWCRDVQVTIENIFGENTRHLVDFNDIEFVPKYVCTGEHEIEVYKRGLITAVTMLDSFIFEIETFGRKGIASAEVESICGRLDRIMSRFHRVCRQLAKRHAGRATIEIKDEYDVQDLFHALLKLDFEDIRPEEYSPSYGGSASRLDFLLKKEKVVVEIKMTRKSLRSKEIGEQLIVDIRKYAEHPACDELVCFVYDPEYLIANPHGIEFDLSRSVDNLSVKVIIEPKN